MFSYTKVMTNSYLVFPYLALGRYMVLTCNMDNIIKLTC